MYFSKHRGEKKKRERKKKKLQLKRKFSKSVIDNMACFLPFSSKNLDVTFFTFRPSVVLVDELVEALRHFCLLCAENLGCVHSAIFRSIHGSMIIWYGAWSKGSYERKESLNAALLPMLNEVLSMAILIDHCFLDAYAGASRDGAPAAKLCNGDTISMYSATPSSDDITDKVSYANLAIFKSHFLAMNGSKAGACLKSRSTQRIIGLCVWKSLQLCYSYILNSDYRKTVLPYLDGLQIDVKYDVFRVVYVSGENVVDSHLYSHYRVLQNEVDKEVF